MRRRDRAFIDLDGAFILLNDGLLIFESLTRYRVLLHQGLVACQIRAGFAEHRGVFFQGALGLGERRLILGGIDFGENLSGLDVGALGKIDLGEHACDLRNDIITRPGLGGAKRRYRHGDRLGLNRHDINGNGLGRSRLGWLGVQENPKQSRNKDQAQCAEYPTRPTAVIHH